MNQEIKIPLPSMGNQKQIVKQEESGLFEGLRIETRLPYKQGWKQPTPEEVRTILKQLNLTGSQAGDLVGVDSRSVRKWTASENTSNFRRIPYAAWRLLVIELEKRL